MQPRVLGSRTAANYSVYAGKEEEVLAPDVGGSFCIEKVWGVGSEQRSE